MLHQAPFVSGISTLLPAGKAKWVADLSTSNEIIRHDVKTTTLSTEIAANGIAVVDMLKIDVEGHFLEVLAGLSDADYARVRNMVIEVDYSEQACASPAEVAAMLAARGYTTEVDDMTLYAWRR